jgi:hypothetical protein
VNRLPLVVVGLVGLVAGGAIGMVAFEEDTKTVTSPPQVVTNNQTRTKTVRSGGGGGKTVTRTQTVTAPAQSYSAPGDAGGGGPVRTVSGERTFTGKDFKVIGTLKVKQNSVLDWTNDGNVFSVISQTQLHVTSTKKKGSVRLYKGSYPEFRIGAIGRWTVKIRPR